MGREIRIPIGHMALGRRQGILSTRSLGSCVAIVIYDRIERAGGMAHCFLPTRPNGRGTTIGASPGRYVDTAVPAMVSRLLRKGAHKTSLEARLVGGAAMFRGLGHQLEVGARNTEAAHRILTENGIKIGAVDIGGHMSRTVWLDLATGKVTIRYAGLTKVEL